MTLPSLYFVTQNPNKLNDMQQLLPNYNLQQVSINLPEPQTLDIHTIVTHKLNHAYAQLQKPCFVMDAALSLVCLNNFPGPLVKWYYSTVGAQKTCQIAQLFGETKASCTVALAYHNGNSNHVLIEHLEGNVPTQPQGTIGYDWDDIFIPQGATKTMASMTFEEKQRHAPSARLAQQLQQLLAYA